MRAIIKRCEEGYVAVWHEGYDNIKLRNFGNYRSAAYDFCQYINNRLALTDKLITRINGFAASYNPEDRYTYPEISPNGSLTLRKQKD